MTETHLDRVLRLLGLSDQEAQGLLPLMALVRVMEEAEAEYRRE